MPWIEKEGRTVEEAQQAAVAAAGMPEDDLEIEIIREGAKGLFGLGGEAAVVRVRPRDEARDVRHAFRDDLTPPQGERGSAPAAAPAPPAEAGAEEPDVAVAEGPQPAPSGPEERGSASAGAAQREPVEAGAEERSPAPSERVPSGADEDDEGADERQQIAVEVGSELVRGILERMDLEGDVQTRVSGNTVYVEVFGEGMGILIGRGGATLEALQELVRAGVQRRVKTRQPLVVDVEGYWERRRSRRRGGSRGERSREPRG